MAGEFKHYETGFGKHKFNRILDLIRRNRVLPIRPGWEQTPDGIVPPAILPSTSSGGARPFKVTKTDDLIVTVNTGRYAVFGTSWSEPSWLTGSFNSDHEISETKTLYLAVTISQSRGADGPGSPAGPTISAQLAWYPTGTHPSQDVAGLHTFEVDFEGGFISDVFNPEASYVTNIEIATVTVADGAISAVDQWVDYNVLVPANVNKFYEATTP